MKVRVLLLLLLLPGVLSAPTLANELVKFAIGEYPPYTSPNEPDAKLLEHLVTAAFKQQSIDVEYGYYPWKRSFAMTKSGEVDGTFPWPTDTEREREFIISESPVFVDQGVYWHLRSTSFDWNNIEDLKNYTFGVSVGYRIEKFYLKHGIKYDMEVSDESNFKKLLAGRIDAYRTSRIVGAYTLNKLFGANIESNVISHPRVAEILDFYILFSKRTPRGERLSKEFSTGLKKLKESGEYQKIVQKLQQY